MKQTEKLHAPPCLSKEYGCSLTDHKDAFIRVDIASIGFGMAALKTACEWFDILWLFRSVR